MDQWGRGVGGGGGGRDCARVVVRSKYKVVPNRAGLLIDLGLGEPTGFAHETRNRLGLCPTDAEALGLAMVSLELVVARGTAQHRVNRWERRQI